MIALARLWRDHRIALLAFCAAAVLTLFFAARLALSVLFWSDPGHRNQSPEGWMTVGYVARSWGIPRDRLTADLGLARPEGHPPTLEMIARDRGIPLATFVSVIMSVIIGERLAHPDPGDHP